MRAVTEKAEVKIIAGSRSCTPYRAHNRSDSVSAAAESYVASTIRLPRLTLVNFDHTTVPT
jgi:hypothetical protein